MKEVEKNEIKRLSDRLDAIRHQQADLSLVEAADKYAELEKEKATLEAEILLLFVPPPSKAKSSPTRRNSICPRSFRVWATWMRTFVMPTPLRFSLPKKSTL